MQRLRTYRLRLVLLLSVCLLHLLPAARGQQMGWQSAAGFGSDDQQRGYQDAYAKTISDAAGNRYMLGNCPAFMSFGSVGVAPTGSLAGFLMKLDAQDVPQWVVTINGATGLNGGWFSDVCLGPDGRLYVTGGYTPGSSLDGGATVLPDQGSFLAIYTPLGQLVQTEVLSHSAGTGVAAATCVAVLDSTTCIITGAVYATATFGGWPITLPRNNTAAQPFVARYSLQTHTTTWLTIASVSRSSGSPFVLTDGRYCYVSGTYYGTGTLFGTSLPPGPNHYNGGAYAACLDSAGNVVWMQRYWEGVGVNAIPPWQTKPTLIGDALSVIAVTDPSVQFSSPGQPLPTLGSGFNPYWLRFDTQTGALRRVVPLTATVAPNVFGGVGVGVRYASPPRLLPDGLYWGGGYAGTVDFGPVVGSRTLPAGSPGDAFVAKFDTSGVCQWLVTAASTSGAMFSPSVVSDLDVTAAGAVRVAGLFNGPTSFGSTTLIPGGFLDFFVGTVARVNGLPDEDAAREEGMALFPNPAHDVVRLQLARPAESAESVSILDGVGRVVRCVVVPRGSREFSLDVAELPAGIYVVRCGATARRLVVK